MSPLPGRGTRTTIDDDAFDVAVAEKRGTTAAARLADELGEPPTEVKDALEAAGASEGTESTEDGEVSSVVKHLDAAVAAALDEGMSTAELMGMLFYYAHNVAQGAREGALNEGG